MLFSMTYTPRYEELFSVSRVSRKYHFTSPQRSIRFAYLLVLGVMAFVFIRISPIMARWFEPLTGHRMAIWPPLILLLFVLSLVVWIYCYKLLPRLTAKWLAQRKPLEPLTVTINDQRIEWRNDEAGAWLSWPSIERVFVTPKIVGLIAGAATYYVPRRAFASDTEFKSFLNEVWRHLPPPAQDLSRNDRALSAEIG
jgi:hypothetical protein